MGSGKRMRKYHSSWALTGCTPRLIGWSGLAITIGVPASPLSEPVVLVQSASLLVKVVDAASGEPIATGAVSLNLPSGRKLGSPVPFNKAGVKLGTLSPGDTMVAAEAIGYEPSGPLVVTLVGGESKELTIRLKKAAR